MRIAPYFRFVSIEKLDNGREWLITVERIGWFGKRIGLEMYRGEIVWHQYPSGRRVMLFDDMPSTDWLRDCVQWEKYRRELERPAKRIDIRSTRTTRQEDAYALPEAQ